MKTAMLHSLARIFHGFRQPAGVAQTSSLPYRGFPIRRRDQAGTACRLEVGDTAGWKPALRNLGSPVPPLGILFCAIAAICGPIWSASAALLGPQAQVRSDPTLLQCGNLIYAGEKSSVCFADRFLTEVAEQTCLRVNRRFCRVHLDSEELFDFPFCVMSGNESFSLSERERNQARKFLAQGGFLLVSPGCSDEKWDRSFRQEIKVCFPEYALQRIPMTHPIFSIVNPISRLIDKYGEPVSRRTRNQREAGARLFQGGPQRRRARRRLLLLRRQ